jgi:hypothetical protein
MFMCPLMNLSAESVGNFYKINSFRVFRLNTPFYWPNNLSLWHENCCLFAE